MEKKMIRALSVIQGKLNQNFILRGEKCLSKSAIEQYATEEGVPLDDVLKEIEEWEKQGYVKLIRGKKCYLEIVRTFEIPGLFRHKPFSNKKHIESVLGELEAGFNRFFSEGQSIFSKDFVNVVLAREHVKIEDVFKKLQEWEKMGFIVIIGQDKEYIKVLKPIRDYSIRYHSLEL